MSSVRARAAASHGRDLDRPAGPFLGAGRRGAARRPTHAAFIYGITVRCAVARLEGVIGIEAAGVSMVSAEFLFVAKYMNKSAKIRDLNQGGGADRGYK